MFSTLFFDLLSLLGTLLVCVLITIVGIVLFMLIGGIITAVKTVFKKKDTEDNYNGTNT